MKSLEKVVVFCVFVCLVVLIILLIPILLPLILLNTLINRFIRRGNLKKAVKLNNGKIYFIYADYNNFDFSEIFQKRYGHIICVKTERRWERNPLVKHLIKDCFSKSYPRLVKLDQGHLIEKEHYNSFKYYYKKNNNIEAFLSLVEKSIHNLERDWIIEN